MKEIELIQGQIHIPKEFELSETKRRLHIKMPYQVRIDTLSKDNFTVCSRHYFRHKSLKQKPYIPEDTVEIDGIRFKVVKPQTQALQDNTANTITNNKKEIGSLN